MEDTRVMGLQYNDAFSIIVAEDEIFPYKVGDQYKDYDTYVEKIFYSSKKWWQFWKKTKVIGAIIRVN